MIEQDLDSLLKTLCVRTFPDVAPHGIATPYVVWQGIGGRSIRDLSGGHGNARNTHMQISVWSKTRLEATTLIRQIEDALVSSELCKVARPEAEPLSTWEEDTSLYGSIQRFSIWSART